MNRGQRSTVWGHLVWLVVQGTFFVPTVLGTFRLSDVAAGPWILRIMVVVMAVWLAYCLVRNLVRLWCAPSEEAGVGFVICLAAGGAWLGLIASGPLVQGSAVVEPFGVIGALLSANLWALALRDVLRLRRRKADDHGVALTPGVR